MVKISLNVFNDETCVENNEQFWFEHYPVGHKLRNVMFLAFFAKKEKIPRSGTPWLRRQIPAAFQNDLQKPRKIFNVLKSKF